MSLQEENSRWEVLFGLDIFKASYACKYSQKKEQPYTVIENKQRYWETLFNPRCGLMTRTGHFRYLVIKRNKKSWLLTDKHCGKEGVSLDYKDILVLFFIFAKRAMDLPNRQRMLPYAYLM